LCADDSAATSVKVGYRQANYSAEPAQLSLGGLFAFGRPERSPSTHPAFASYMPTETLLSAYITIFL
ncbi:hypothetical protein ACI48D_25930, partial [Massilia sp. LXY-6]|uniref:hypothetical protein n=1 Tax=Massilia sp. LXY-6 TaxID=3379823 RepID=UPI003EE02423